MTIASDYTLLLRFRDLVTEPGGNITEHRRIIRQRGYDMVGMVGSTARDSPPNSLRATLPIRECPKRRLALR